MAAQSHSRMSNRPTRLQMVEFLKPRCKIKLVTIEKCSTTTIKITNKFWYISSAIALSITNTAHSSKLRTHAHKSSQPRIKLWHAYPIRLCPHVKWLNKSCTSRPSQVTWPQATTTPWHWISNTSKSLANRARIQERCTSSSICRILLNNSTLQGGRT